MFLMLGNLLSEDLRDVSSLRQCCAAQVGEASPRPAMVRSDKGRCPCRTRKDSPPRSDVGILNDEAESFVVASTLEKTRFAQGEALISFVFRRHGRALLTYAVRLTGDNDLAESIVQEVLVRACRQPGLL